MAGFVLDASIALSWCFPDHPTENTPYSRAILERVAQDDAVVPEIWPFEIANGIFVAYSKRKRITEAELHEYVQLLKSFPIRVIREEWPKNIGLESLARKHNLAAYDVACLDLALRENLPLATSDQELKKAALADGVVLI
jgi:predicted nucleic acid-binding protein